MWYYIRVPPHHILTVVGCRKMTVTMNIIFKLSLKTGSEIFTSEMIRVALTEYWGQVVIKSGNGSVSHDDVIRWKHFPRNWPFVQGIHRSPVNSPHKGQWRGALMFSLICVWINDWVKNREAGDLRRYLASLWRHCNDQATLHYLVPNWSNRMAFNGVTKSSVNSFRYIYIYHLTKAQIDFLINTS